MKELGPDAFTHLTAEYAREGKTVIGYTLWEDGPNYGLPKMDVKWVWTVPMNGCVTMDSNHA